MLPSPWKQEWGSVVLLLCVWGCGVSVGGAGAGGRPNVVFVMADDLGWNDVVWHNPRMQSPFLHHLSHHHGIILNQSYVNVACSPTRSAFLTGHYPYHIGTQEGVFWVCEPAGVPTKFKFFPEVLQTMGYSTYMVGKWHLGYCKTDYLPTSRGFDRFYGLYMGRQDHFNHTLVSVDPVFQHLFSSKAIEMIKTHKETKKNPFFLYMAFTNVHAVLQVPNNYTTHCPQKNKWRRIYCGMLRALDEAVGRIVDALKETGQYNNTVIIFSTDNGGETHKAGDGIDQWDMIRKNSPGKRRTLVYKIYKQDAAIRYKNFKYIKGNPGSPSGWIKPDGLFAHWAKPKTKTFRCAQNKKPKIRLFNLKVDPTEHFNVAKKYPRVVAEMERVLARLREGYVESIHRKPDKRGDPKHFNGTYATGWCDHDYYDDYDA